MMKVFEGPPRDFSGRGTSEAGGGAARSAEFFEAETAASPPPLHHAPHGPPPLQRQGRNERGFTLVEMMVVIVIIGLLAAVVIVNVMPAADQARRTRVETDLTRIEEALNMYRLSNARYPTTQEGIGALVPQYITRPPADPWGNPYVYVAPGPNGAPYRIASLGADKREGGTGDDADITK
jgi:general secretion pathway protein G